MARVIGIRHRVKKTAKNEARPTMVWVITGEEPIEYKLETSQDELDFLYGLFPRSWRKAEEGEDLSSFKKHHIRKRKRAGEETIHVPTAYEGLQEGDTAAMTLGGSGDRFAFALSNRGERIGAKVIRITPHILKDKRGDAPKDNDHKLLAELGWRQSSLFYTVTAHDREHIKLTQLLRERQDAQKRRIACEQGICSNTEGNIFLSEDGCYPEGTIEEEFKKAKHNDEGLAVLARQEEKREKTLVDHVQTFDVWEKILAPVEGCGAVIAAKIMAPIADIRRFATDSKFKAYCGVHVLPDGTFPRRRVGRRANWSGDARQAFYLMGAQFVYRTDSEWGKKLREYKAKFREKHPEVVEIDGKRRYTDMHIHNMAVWRTITRFAQWLWKEWTDLESGRGVKSEAA